MTERNQLVASTLSDLALHLRGADEPLFTLDVIRCLLFLRYASSSSFRLNKGAHPVLVPQFSRWSYLQACQGDLARELGRACREMEDANPILEGTLTGVDFTQVERWDSGRRDRILKKLIDGASELPECSDVTQIGEIYDLLVTSIATYGGKGGAGGMFLPIPLARLMTALLNVANGMVVCDPVCKAGRALVACATHARESHLDLVLHGQDASPQMVAICKLNLLLHGAPDVQIEPGNALWAPILTPTKELARYDRVITAPPINLAHWGAEDAAADPFGRFSVVPPKHNADYAYILHCLAILKDGGRAVVLIDRGVLFRQGGEERVREMLVENDHFEAVISLPGGLLYGTHIPAALLVLRKGDSPKRGRVLFVELGRPSERRPRDEALLPEEESAICDVVSRFEGRENLARVANLEEIRREQWILNPALYVARSTSRANVAFLEIAENIRALEARRDEAIRQMDGLVQELTDLLHL
jgi:type I restriction enzyme M protein